MAYVNNKADNIVYAKSLKRKCENMYIEAVFNFFFSNSKILSTQRSNVR